MSETIFPTHTHTHTVINVHNSPSKSFKTFKIQLGITNRGIKYWSVCLDFWWAWWPLFLPQTFPITLLSSFIRAAEMLAPIFLKNTVVSFYFFLLTVEWPLINVLRQLWKRPDFTPADIKLSLPQHRELHNWLGLSGPKSSYLKLNFYSISGHLNFALIFPSFSTSSGSSSQNPLFQSSMVSCFVLSSSF